MSSPSGARRVINNTAWLTADKAIHAVVGILVGLWVARYLGPEKYGWLSYAIAFIGFFKAISRVGMDNVAIKEIVEDESQASTVLGTTFRLRLIFAALSFALCSVGLFIFNPEPRVIVLMGLILASGVFFQIFDIADHLFQARVQSKYTVISKKGAYLISSLVKVLLIIGNAEVIYFSWAILLEMLLAIPLLLYFVKKSGHSISGWKFDALLQKKMLRQSYPIIFSTLLIVVYLRIDQIMIGEMMGSEDLGKYAAAVRISEMWNVIPMAIVASVFPAIIKAYNRSRHEFDTRMHLLNAGLFWLPFFVALGLTFFSESVMLLLYGEPFSGSGIALSIQVWASIFVGFNSISYRYYVLIEKTGSLLLRSVIGVVINIILNFILIPEYGIAGAAIATLVSQLAVGWLFNAGAAPELFAMQVRAISPLSLNSAFTFTTELIRTRKES